MPIGDGFGLSFKFKKIKGLRNIRKPFCRCSRFMIFGSTFLKFTYYLRRFYQCDLCLWRQDNFYIQLQGRNGNNNAFRVGKRKKFGYKMRRCTTQRHTVDSAACLSLFNPSPYIQSQAKAAPLNTAQLLPFLCIRMPLIKNYIERGANSPSNDTARETRPSRY